MDSGAAQMLLSILQAAAAAPLDGQALPSSSGGARKRHQHEPAGAQLAPVPKQPRLGSAEELQRPAAGLKGSAPCLPQQPASQLALVLQLSGAAGQPPGGALPPLVRAVLSALPLAKKQELLLAMLRMQAQDGERARQGVQLPQRQTAHSQLAARPPRSLPQPTAAPVAGRHALQSAPSSQQHRPGSQPQPDPLLPLPPQQLPGRPSVSQLTAQQQPAAGWAPAQVGPGQVPAVDTPLLPQQPVRPKPRRGSPPITRLLFLRLLQERALAAAGAGRA